MSADLIAHAVMVAENLGAPVFPVIVQPDPEKPGKMKKSPLIKEWQKSEATNPQAIEELFKQRPHATHVGILTGEKSRLLAVDLDGEPGQQWWREHGDLLPMTRTQRTQRPGGKHLLYRVPAGCGLRNTAGKIAPGVDIRADDGFIVDWSREFPPEIEDLTDAPPALIEFLKSATKEAPKEKTANGSGKFGEGERHAALIRHAALLRRRGLKGGELEGALLGWNAEYCDPPQDRDDVIRIAQDFSKKEGDDKSAKDDAQVRERLSEARIQGHLAAWPDPASLPDGLPPVASFNLKLLPVPLRDLVDDCADRMQCPIDYAAVAAVMTLAAVVQRRCGIRPKRHDDWTIVPNLWGIVIGRPGILKSPAISEVMRPLHLLQTRALDDFATAKIDSAAHGLLASEAEKVAKAAIQKALRAGDKRQAYERAQDVVAGEIPKPVCKRYIVNDSTVEKLGELLAENHFGLLCFRDELSGWFRTLEKQGHESDRAFYLECWNGTNRFTCDTISRGTIHIPGACLSVFGSMQPGPAAALVHSLRGTGDDGLLQRFQLCVYPDAPKTWRNVDRAPNFAARTAMQDCIARLDQVTAANSGLDPGIIPVMNFDSAAQELFDHWRESLELRLRNDSEHPILEAHLSKYRKLVPALALLIHLAEKSESPVELTAVERAVQWAEYLETHARRIYSPALAPDLEAARALAKRIEAGDVGHQFTIRDIYRRCWAQLATREDCTAAISVLIDYDILHEFVEPTPGRARRTLYVNPKFKAWEST